MTGSPVAAAAPALSITFPDHGQYYGDAATVRGFVRPVSDDSGPAKIVIAGKPVSVSQGAFEAALSRADLGVAASATEWSAEVTAVYPGGARVSQTVKFSNSLDARRENAASGLLTADLAAGAAKTLTHHGASLEIGAGATDKAVRITMQALKESELPALGSGLVNVTKGGGYRFLPHGRHFKKQVKVRLPYDKAKLPEGAKESDIKTFYFDTVTGAWQPLQTAATDTAKGEIHALTGHFTDMINGVVQTPDSPEAASFNPTQIKDLKAADPGAKVNLIAPPGANAMGDVRLSYPIELPAGRTGHAPQLALSYNSSGENGWLSGSPLPEVPGGGGTGVAGRPRS